MSIAPRTPVVAVISAVTSAVEPARAAITLAVPDAVVWNILDDRLMADAVAGGGVTTPLAQRMERLVDHAIAGGADTVLVTCSLYGETVEVLAPRKPVPVLPPDQAAFDAVVDAGWRRVLVVAPLEQALADSRARLAAHAAAVGKSPELLGVVASGLPDDASRTPHSLAAALATSVAAADTAVDGILLAQYSLSPAAGLLNEQLGIPVLSTPGCAARRLADSLRVVGPAR